uniref:C2 domain-containing protein n=1 Tax=Panagrolaimus davidi TaxID=227884 RepID=A0A914QXR2_9BILA
MKTAYNSDKRTKFRYTSGETKFSTSVVDIFTQFYEGYDIVKKINFPNSSFSEEILSKFSRTIKRSILGYADMVYKDIDDNSGEEQIACTLMNNVEQLKVQLDKLYKHMENTEANADGLKILKKEINNVLEKIIEQFVAPVELQIHEKVKNLGTSLAKVKMNKNKKHMDYDIIHPLVNFLEASLHRYHALCEKTILEEILKELWKTTILSIQNFIVLPGKIEKNYMDQFSKDKKSSAIKIFDFLNKPENGKLLSQEQVKFLKEVLSAVKDCLHAEGYALDQKFLDSTPEFKAMKYTLSQYFEKTQNIIKDFISNQKDKDSNELSIGSINVQINLDLNHNSGKIHGKLLAAKNLAMLNLKKTDLKIFAKVYLVGPYHGYQKHKTTPIDTALKLQFNDLFDFSLNIGEQYSNFELVFKIIETSLFKTRKLLGIGVLKLDKVLKSGSISTWVPLYHQLQFDENNFIQLRILSQRENDETAKEFVKMITTHTKFN